ncbi:MAG: YkgJ family cysteine cluster protein [Candidatus Heimdallarchaeaceae archaeon]
MSDAEPTKEQKRYVHNCTKCGQCCEKWEEVPIYIEDLQRWINDGTLQYAMPFIHMEEIPPVYIRLKLKKPETEDDPNPSGCPLYDYANKICNVYSSMPVHCAAYPLAYNGEKHFLVDNESPGLGEGSMTNESLTIARQRAKDHFEAISNSSALLPFLYTLILGEIMRKSQEAMSTLSEDDKKQLEDLLSKPDDEESESITEESVEEPTEESVEEPTEEPVEEPTEEPVEESVEESVEEPVEESVEEPVEDPTEEE